MKFEKRFILQRLFFIGFWLATCTGFVSDLVWHHGESSILRTASLLAVDVILLFLALCTLRKAFDIILISSFVIISFFSTCILNDSGIMWHKHLSTILPVSLVAVVLLWIVRSCYIYTTLCAKLTDSE